LTACTAGGGKVIVAWGKDGAFRGRAVEICRLMDEHDIPLWALRVNKDGQPGHPLYIGYDVQPVLWKGSK
jgi:hypothetical protein